MTSTHRPSLLDHAAAALLALAYLALLVATPDMGFTRDESFYFYAADQYKGWFVELEENVRAGHTAESFTQENIDRHWSYNPEHPVLVKTAFALSGLILHDRLDVLSRSEAYRFPGMVFGSLALAALYLFTVAAYRSRLAALVAVGLLAFLPRYFFHAHLTCFDIPILSVWVVFMYAYWRSLDSTGWAWATGVLWGIGLITKLNAFFFPLVLLAHWGLRAFPHIRFGAAARVRVPPVPLALFTMAALGPIIFYMGWPRHWFDTWHRVLWYLRFHLGHEHYYVRYFGLSLWEPPFPRSYPYVMTLTTTPVPTLIAFFFGAGWLLREWVARLRAGTPDPRGTGLLVGLNLFVPFWIISRPDTPIFGGVKHWLPAIPFLCMIAGVGVARARDAFASISPRMGILAASAITAPTLAIAALDTAESHPFGTSYFNALVGYYTGAADLGGMRHFWGYTSRAGLEFLDENVPRRGSVHFHDTTGLAADMYKDEGWLRRDIVYSWTYDASDYIALDPEEGFAGQLYATWTRFDTQSPAFNANLRGVPILSIYRNDRRLGPPEPTRAGSEPPATTRAGHPRANAHRGRAEPAVQPAEPDGQPADPAGQLGEPAAQPAEPDVDGIQ
ncbi:MAG: glycosyltransferase family 39 protein [Myxococcales bacterium]|nr:glycosyltransferase family 39 protein [Myxococcales bacterium]MCB9532915.1 glycosyltransferase family 39 protein [Myxococcales bacterium]